MIRSLRLFSSSSSAMIGKPLPKIQVQLDAPSKKVEAFSFFEPYKRAILFGVPGAFTPGCSKTHLPGYLKEHDRLKKEFGVDRVACVSVNDAFVMSAWGQANNVGDKVVMLADPDASFVKALGLSFDAKGVLGNERAVRFAMVLKNGIIQKVFIEPDKTGLSCSLASSITEELKKLK